MPPKNLVFVNKTADSESLTQSAGRERTQIFSHVQRGPGSRRSQDTRPSSQRRKRLRLPRRQREESEGQLSDESSDNNLFLEPTMTYATIEDSQIQPDIIDLKLSLLDASGIVRTQPVLDPDTAATTYMSTVLQFYSTPHACKAFSTQMEIAASYHYAVGLAETDPALRFALICTVSSSLSLMTGEKQHRDYSFYFKCLALAGLREQLNGKDPKEVETSTLFAISLLLWVECIEGSTQDAEFHVSALQRMLSRFSSTDQLPLSIATTVFGFPYLCSAMMRTPPIALPAVTEAVNISPNLIDDIDRHARQAMPLTARRFLEMSITDALGSDLTGIIKRLRINRAFQFACRRGELRPEYQETQAMVTEEIRINRSLAALPYELETPLTPLQNATRIALFVSFQPIVNIMGPSSAFCKSMMQQLRENLENSDIKDLWAPNLELLLWVLFVYVHCSHDDNDLAWAVEHVHSVLSVLRMDAEESIERILCGFFYEAVQHEATLHRLRYEVSSRYGAFYGRLLWED